MKLKMPKKFIVSISASILAISLLLAPVSAFASSAKPVPTTPPVGDQLQPVTPAPTPAPEDGTVEQMGVKKTVFIFALKNGGKVLEEFLEYLGKKEYADVVKDNRIAIAEYLETVEKIAENALVDFLIFELGIKQGTARVIANCILFFVL